MFIFATASRPPLGLLNLLFTKYWNPLFKVANWPGMKLKTFLLSGFVGEKA